MSTVASAPQPPTTVRVLLVDDEAPVREALRDLLSVDPGIEVVAEAADGIEAVRLSAAYSPDVVLLDVRMPKLDGLSSAERLVGTGPAVVMLTTFDDASTVDRAVDAGVAGFLLKSGDPRDLLAGIRTAARGGSCLAPTVARRLLSRLHRSTRSAAEARTLLDALTPRQRDLLGLLARGHTNAEIADTLHLSEGTVKAYLRDLFTRLGVRNRVEAALVVHRASIAASDEVTS